MDADSVSVFDCISNTLVTQVAVDSIPLAVSFDPLNEKLYCANSGSANVTVIDGRGDTVLTTIAVGARPAALEWNGAYNRTYVANSRGSTVSVLRDSVPSGVGGTMNDERGTMNPGPTVIRRVLFLPASPFTLHSSLFSLSGRKVLDLKPGANDVRGLASGVYFIRYEPRGSSRTLQVVRKIVIGR